MATQPITSEAGSETVATMPAAPAPVESSPPPNIPIPPPVPTANGVNGHGVAATTASTVVATSAATKSDSKPANDESAGTSETVEPLPDKPGKFSGAFDVARKFWRGVPSWLASLLIHVAMFVALGLFYLEPPKKTEVTVVSNT